MKDLETLQARIQQAVSAERNVEYVTAELKEAIASADVEGNLDPLTKREEMLAIMYSLTIFKMQLAHIREVAELERQLRARSTST